VVERSIFLTDGVIIAIQPVLTSQISDSNFRKPKSQMTGNSCAPLERSQSPGALDFFWQASAKFHRGLLSASTPTARADRFCRRANSREGIAPVSQTKTALDRHGRPEYGRA
jgi:hypothetical protein